MDAHAVTEGLWADLDGDRSALDRLTLTGPSHTLPSVFPVTAAATGSVAGATLAVSELWRRRGAPAERVAVDSRHASLAFRSERLVRAVDHSLGEIWDPLAGLYAASDRWIRLHTNFRHHRRAALEALELAPDSARVDRVAVGQAVARWPAVELEDAIYDAGGCAGALRSREEWRASAEAEALEAQPVVEIVPLPASEGPASADRVDRDRDEPGSRPLTGLRVLDLSRVIAGPVAGRFLAAYGADVLRVDAPDGEDGSVTVVDTVVGKRAAYADLREPAGRATFERLVAGADVVLCAYRPGALEKLGYGAADLARLRPGLVVGTLTAYGNGAEAEARATTWGARRGFDSLVQMTTGVADEGRLSVQTDVPVPLPAQLLDHATGYILAAGVLTALGRQRESGGSGLEAGYHVRVSLARTSSWLDGLGRGGVIDMADPPDELPEDLAVDLHGPMGHTRHIACPGVIVGAAPHWGSGPVPLGYHDPTWA